MDMADETTASSSTSSGAADGQCAASGSGATRYKFPEALLKTPRCLIALSGLDTRNNAVHRMVWDEFTAGSKRVERRPILYKQFPANHIYAAGGSNSRLSYDDYSPVGILKLNWLLKHTEEIPALVVFFFDLDWNDPQWDERQTECVSKVEVIRSALHKHSTEIVMILLQSGPPMPAGDTSSIQSERGSALCAACELPRLNLFVLPFTQRPQGFVMKIEEQLYKRAIHYYTNQLQYVKAHRDMLMGKSGMHLLNIRHMFKLAFFTEMKAEPVNALKLYRSAYSYLTENMYLSEDRAMEFKMVAGFISYKICRLSFENEEPLNSINQFRRHVDRFINDTGPRHLAFEHMEWLSRQFSAFGDLFSSALKQGLKGIQTQNPGIYYYQAALYAIERKKLSNKVRLDVSKSAGQPLPSLPEITYYGQRPWRVGLADDKPSNMDLRQKCIVAIQAAEGAVEHSWQIIPLLTTAISHFKTHRSERMMALLKVLLAEEYYHVGQYSNALTLLEDVVVLYRQEQWWGALSSVLQTILRCSFLLGKLPGYLDASLELTSRYLSTPEEEKRRIQNNMAAILAGHMPSPEMGVASDVLGVAREKWAELWQSESPKKITVQASSLASSVECRTRFSCASFKADEPVEMSVFLLSSAPLPLTLSHLCVVFYQEEYNKHCVIESSFQLDPHQIKTFSFSFPASQSSIRDTIEVHNVTAVLEGEGCIVSMVWNRGSSEAFSTLPPPLSWQKITSASSTYIQPRSPNIAVALRHQPPALTGEHYCIRVEIINQEKAAITNLQLVLTLPDTLDESQPPAELSDAPPISAPQSPERGKHTHHQQGHQVELSCGQLEEGLKFERQIYLCSSGIGSRKLDVNVMYHIACKIREDWEPVFCLCQKSHSATVKIAKPFDMMYKLLSTDFKPLGGYQVVYDDPFVVFTEIQCTSPWKLIIQSSQFHQGKGVSELGNGESQIEGLELEPGDKATECHCLTVPRPLTSSSSMEGQLLLGTYTMRWTRATSSHPHSLVSTVSFPPISAKLRPFTVTADIPANGQLHQIMPISYTVHNRTQLVQEVESKMGQSEAFMYSGNRQHHFRILPMSQYTLTFNLYPVHTGLVNLPTFELAWMRKGEDPSINTSMIPTSVYVKPSPVVRDDVDVDLSISSVA